MKYTEFQLKEIVRYCFDLSKLTVASLILKFFEPNSSIAPSDYKTIAAGLTLALAFVILGLLFSRRIKK